MHLAWDADVSGHSPLALLFGGENGITDATFAERQEYIRQNGIKPTVEVICSALVRFFFQKKIAQKSIVSCSNPIIMPSFCYF
jgi:hypothetical protein